MSKTGFRENYSLFFRAVILLLGGLLVASCSGKNQPEEKAASGAGQTAMAEIGDYEVSEKEFMGAFRDIFERSGHGLNVTPTLLRQILDQRVNFYSVVQYGVDQNWDRDHEGLYQKNLIYRQVMMDEFKRSLIEPQVTVEEEDLEQLFHRYNTHLRASHLYAADRETADSLHNLVTNGVSFDELARDIFESEELKHSGGDLGYFTVDDMDVGFENVAYSMPVGEVSEPVRTSRGFSIIKVTDRITSPIITEYEYARSKENIRELAIRQQTELQRREHMDRTIDRYRFNEELMSDLWEKMDGYLGKDPVAGVELEDFYSRVPEAWYGKVLGSHNDGYELDVEMFLQEVYYTPLEARRNITDIRSFRNLVEGVAYRSHSIRTYHNSGAYDEDLVVASVENTFQNYLNRRLKQNLKDNVELSPEELQREFRRNRDAYIHPREVNMAELAVRDMDTAEEAYEAIQDGMPFLEALEKYGFDEEAKQAGGEIGYTPVDHFGTISPALSDIQPGEIAGPFEMASDVIFLFQCLGVREAQPMTFEEAKPVIVEELTEAQVAEKRQNIIRETMDRHDARVHYDLVDEVELQL